MKDTNIISDQEFLDELLKGSQENLENQQKEETTDLEDILAGTYEEPKAEPKSKETTEDKTTEETATPAEPEEKQIEEAEATTLKRFGVKDTVNTLIENDVWVDMAIKYDGKEYDNIEDLITKERPSKELFEALSVAQKTYREQQLNENYIAIKGKDETKLKLVNAILSDADYTDLLEYNSEVVEPLKKIDFSMIENGDRYAEAFVRQCLIDIDGYPEKYIEAEIRDLKQSFKLIEKAEEYQNKTIENFNKEIEIRKESKILSQKQAEKQLKEDVKSLKTELEKQDLKGEFSNQIVKLRYTKDDSGSYHYENLIKDRIKDKSFEAKLMHFLLDEEDFVNKEKAKVKSEASKKYLELVNIIPSEKGSKTPNKKASGNLETNDEDLLKEIGIII